MIEGLGSEPRLHLAQRDFRYASEADIEARIRMSALLLKPDISAPRRGRLRSTCHYVPKICSRRLERCEIGVDNPDGSSIKSKTYRPSVFSPAPPPTSLPEQSGLRSTIPRGQRLELFDLDMVPVNQFPHFA